MELSNLEIEKLIFGGMGLAKKEGLAVFVEGGIPGEIVDVEIIKKNKSHIKAKIKNVIVPSKNRRKPFCPYFNPCGGGDLQFFEYENFIKEKEKILKEIFSTFYNLKIKPFLKNTEIKD